MNSQNSHNLSELSALSGLPNNWKTVKLGDVCETTSGGTPSRKNPRYYEGKIPWIKSGELNFNIIIDSEEMITKDALENSNARIFPKGTLLIALYGATVGRLAFLGIDASTNQAIAAIFTPSNLSNKFLYWFLFSYREKLLKQRIGGAQPNISQGTLRNIPIPLPPLTEQKKIVAKIEELFSGLDSGVASLKYAKEQIRLYRQSVLASAFSGRLINNEELIMNNEKLIINNSSLPPGWKWVKLESITSKLGDGLHGTPKYSIDGEYYFVNGNNLSDGKIEIKANTKRVNVEEFEKYKKLLNDKTIFVSINGTLGKTAFYNGEKIILGKSVCYFNLKEDINKQYIRYYVTSQRFNNYANIVATGSTIKNVSLKAMREFEVPLPRTLKEQTHIVSEIEKRFSEADNLEKAIDDSLAKSELLRQSILNRAFSGKLV